MTTLPAPNCALGALTWLDECTSQDYSDENMQRRPEEVDEVAAFIRVWFERYPKESCQCNMRKPKWKHWEKRKRAHDYAAPRDEHSRGTVAPTPQVSRPSNVLQLLDPGVPPRLVDLSSGDVDAVCQTIRGNVSGLVQDIIYTMINGGILTIQLIDICLIDLLAARLADPTARHQPIQAPEFSENITAPSWHLDIARLPQFLWVLRSCSVTLYEKGPVLPASLGLQVTDARVQRLLRDFSVHEC